MKVEVLGAEAFEGLRAAWGALVRADPRATPFLSAEWASAWLEHRAGHAQPWIFCVRDNDALVGIAPLVLARRNGVRVVSMLGKEPGDYWDVLAAEADRSVVVEAVAEELRRRARSWDIGGLSCLQPGSPTVNALEAGGLRVLRRAAVRSPAIELPATFDDYLKRLPAKHRSNLRKHLRRVDDGGAIDLRTVTAPQDIATAMARWQVLRREQWRAAGRDLNPEHDTDGFLQFLTAVAQVLVPAGTASVWEFRHEGEVAGVYLNFHDDRAFYWYLGGFDPEHAALGLGKIAIAHGIRESIGAGRERFDFTRGNEPYKYWYGAVDRELPSLVVGHDGLRSRLLVTAAGAFFARRDRAHTAAAG